MSWGGYKPDKTAWVNGGFGEEAGRGLLGVGGDRQVDQMEAKLCAQLVWGPCRAVGAGA